jgi:hypothetical protein
MQNCAVTNPARVIAFIASVVVGTTLVIFAAYWVSHSWAVGATAGVIAGVFSVVLYPVVIRPR